MNATSPAPSTALFRVLLVDDDPSDRQLVTDLLDAVPTARFLIDWTRNLADGLDQLRNAAFDICLFDPHLPDGNGLDLLASADVLGLMLPMIVLTNEPSVQQDHRALSLGASAFLDKGKLDPSMLERVIRYAVRQQKIAGGLARRILVDEATGLISATLYKDRLERALVFAHRRNSEVAVMLIDLAFAADQHDGNCLPNAVLANCGRRLAGELRETDSIARLSEHRLGLLVEGIHSLHHAATVARKVLRKLREPVVIEGRTIEINPSMGVAIYPREGRDGDHLMRQAETAMRRVITDGAEWCRFGSERIDFEAREGMVIERAFGIAFERRELRLRFHPEVYLKGHQNSLACEIFWRHPDRGWLPLDSSLAETDEEVLIKGLADWAFASAGRQLKAWDKEGLKPKRLSLALPFCHRLALAPIEQAVRDQVQSEGFAPDRIVLDLQENLIATDTRRSNADLMSLKATGIRLALDGFGHGQIAFQNLCHGVLDSLKLAPDLYQELPGAASSERLIQALIDFGHGLDLMVSAKGARDQRQFALLKRLGCDAVQLSAFPPMSAEGATAWLHAIAEKPATSGAGPLPAPEVFVPKITGRQERLQNVEPERS